MSSFFLYRHSEKLSDQAAEKISNALTHYPWVTAEIQSINGLQLISTVNKSKKMRVFKDAGTGNIFILQGEVYPSEGGLKDFADTQEGLKNAVIEHYQEKGIDGCAGLNGMYNLIVYSPEKNIFEAATPRLHLLQIYFIPLGQNHFVITDRLSTAKHIPSYKPSIDQTAVFELIATGKNFRERTILQDVIRLQPNSSYTIEDGRLNLRQSHRLPFSKKRWGYNLSQLMEEYEHLYKQAIYRRIKSSDKVLFLQSGGKDSRIFSHFLQKCGIKPEVLVAGDSHHGEVALSRMAAQKLNLKFQQFCVSDDFESRCADKFFGIDGFASEIYGPWPMEIFNCEPASYDCVTAGYLADAVMGNAMYLGKTNPDWDAKKYFEDYIEKQFKKYTTLEELNRLFPGKANELFQAYTSKAFEHFRSLGDDPYQMMIAFDLLNDDCFRLGSIIRVMDAACPITLPHLDNDLLDFNLSLSPALLSKRLFLDVFLIQKAKGLASIPLDRNNDYYAALYPSLKDEIRFRLWQVMTKMVRLPMLKIMNPYKATTQFYGQLYNLNQKGIKRLKENALKDLDLLDGYMDKDAARKILQREAPDNLYHVNAGNAPRSLVTVLHALKYFNSVIASEASSFS